MIPHVENYEAGMQMALIGNDLGGGLLPSALYFLWSDLVASFFEICLLPGLPFHALCSLACCCTYEHIPCPLVATSPWRFSYLVYCEVGLLSGM